MDWYEPNAAGPGSADRRRAGPGATGHRRSAPSTGRRASAPALFDESSFAKIEISGAGAAEFLQWACDNDVARAVGDVTYTQALNERGGIEADFTVTRLADDLFLVVTGTASGSHDLAWLRRQARRSAADVRIADVTGASCCFALWGPQAREILQPLTPTDLGNDAFPFLTAQELTVGDVPVRAQRVTFVGELGWELYASTEYGATLWDTLWAAGRPAGLVAGGYRAIESLRLEKGYRVWGSDLTGETTPYEAGLGFCVKLDKPFSGRDALVAAKATRAGPAAAGDRARRPHAHRPGRRAGAPRRAGGRPGHLGRVRLHRRGVDRLRLPAGAGAAGHAGRASTCSATGSRGEVAAEPLFDPGGTRRAGRLTVAAPPRIGITTYREPARWGEWNEPADLLPALYCGAVQDAGGVAVLLPQAPDDACRTRRWTACTAWSSPAARTSTPRATAPSGTRRPAAPASSATPGNSRWCARRSSATCRCSAICRGLQVLNTARGGTLIQHLPDVVGTDVHAPVVGAYGRHERRAASRAARWPGSAGTGARSPRTTIRRSTGSATGLVACGWADDGTVEAVEVPERTWAIGVQWHPEALAGEALFAALVAACRAVRGRGRAA